MAVIPCSDPGDGSYFTDHSEGSYSSDHSDYSYSMIIMMTIVPVIPVMVVLK